MPLYASISYKTNKLAKIASASRPLKAAASTLPPTATSSKVRATLQHLDKPFIMYFVNLRIYSPSNNLKYITSILIGPLNIPAYFPQLIKSPERKTPTYTRHLH